MIQVNLLPGAVRKKPTRRMPSFGMESLSKLKGTAGFDKLTMFAVASWLIMLPLTGYMFLNTRARANELNVSVEGALADSTKFANVIAANKKMLARRDTIAQKVSIIQEIDAARYVWPHILDEVSRALPPYTWLVNVQSQPVDSLGAKANFRIEGRTGNNFALTRYLTDLEASPFIRNVRLMTTELVRENEKLVYSFQLEASYEVPPPDVIETVPLFAKEPE